MAAPNDYAGESASLRFQRGQITDATLISSSAIVDNKNIAGLPISQCFQKNIDASIMSDRQDSTGETTLYFYRPNSRRSDAKRDL
jgi:hypothetical protein